MKRIECENEFCIYNKNNKCPLDEVELDCLGNCTSMELLNIDSKLLKELKKKAIDRWNEDYSD